MEPKAANDNGQTPSQGSPKVVYLKKETPADLVDNFDSPGYVKSALASRYEILEEIARTDTSALYRAVNVQLGREVALRVLLRAVARDRAYVDMFHRRSRAIDKLSQSNIVRIYDEGVESGIHYRATEFLKGANLEERIKRQGPLPYDVMTGLLLPAISALRHSHYNAIVHGNIKCSSIFLHTDGRIILTGFGIPYGAKGTRPIFRRNYESVEYLSPEEAAGNGADMKSDLYSLGIVMYHAMTGKFPYREGTPEETLHAIMSGIYLPVSDLTETPAWLENIIDRCLQADTSRRVQSCAELMVLFNASSSADVSSLAVGDKYVDSGPGLEFPGVGMQGVELAQGSSRAVEAPPQQQSTVERISDGIGAGNDNAHPVLSHESRLNPHKVAQPENEPVRKPEKPGVKEKSGRILPWLAVTAVLVAMGAGAATIIYRLKMPPDTPAVSNAAPPQTTARKEVIPVESAPEASLETRDIGAPTHAIISEQAARRGIPKATATRVTSEKPEAAGAKDRVAKTSAQRTAKTEREAQPPEPGKPAQAAAVQVVLPDLTGIQLRVAKTILSLNALVVGQVTTKQDPAHDGLVIHQIPGPGTRLAKGTKVNLTIGSK